MKILERVLNVLIRIVNIPLLVLTVIEYLLVTILLLFVIVPLEFFLVMPVFYIATGKFYYNCDFNYKHYKLSCWFPVVDKMDWYINALPVFVIKEVHFGQKEE